MILTKPEILKRIETGHIVARAEDVQENSVNFRLGVEMWHDQQEEGFIDPYGKRDWQAWRGGVDDNGPYWILEPGRLYLGTTADPIGTRLLGDDVAIVPECRARSTTGRHGLTVALCAGVGDVGYAGRWALEILNNNHLPIILRPGTMIGQMIFHYATPTDVSYGGKDRYQKDDGSIRFLPRPYPLSEVTR